MLQKTRFRMDLSLKEVQPSKNSYEYVFKNSIKSDIEIVLKKKVIKAHKEILGKKNPVFLDKFISQPGLQKIEIRDQDPNAVEIFINYLYTDRLIDSDLNEELYLVAHKYLDPNLKNACREKFAKILTVENAAKQLLFFLDHDEQKLSMETSIFIARNFCDVKSRSDFNLILEKKEAINAVFDVFDDCKITILLEDPNPTREELIDSATNSDVTIKVQNHSFLCHKQILSKRNTVFEAMISSSHLSSINIPDSDPKSFKIFLQFLYNQTVGKKDISKELMSVAHKYKNKKLLKICEDYFVSRICEVNAIDLLILSANIGSERLKERTSKLIAEKYAEMKERHEFRFVKQNAEAVEAIFRQFEVRIDELYNSDTVQKGTRAFFGTFVLKLPSGKRSNFVDSEMFYMKNVAWNIYVLKSSIKDFGLFLECNDESDSFEHTVRYSFKLISSVGKTQDVFKGIKIDTFSQGVNERDWGWSDFVSLSVLNDTRSGLLTNGKITVQVYAIFVE